ncbi:PAS domain S-box protein [Methanolobus profundi]|uniref:histidine kinase n=1 Tax=Methanolobus profundi TaxID=487685 RepID=A0A1I4RZF3_9EURY|nr:PAS domain S-box protein [Methanolobus profundi]SFM57333.1 PAS domain S-box-containing protein [Methanolobus profundi]
MTDKDNKDPSRPDVSKNCHDGFENLVDELPLGILSCDREGNITAVNDFLLHIMDSPSAYDTKNINMLKFPPLVRSGISAVVEEVIITGMNASIETPYHSKWGKEMFLSFRAFPRKDESGNTYGCYAIIEDLTNKKKVNDSIENNKRKDMLISHISDRFINSSHKEIDEDINKTLKDLAGFVDADRAVIFSSDRSTDHVIKTHEWHRNDIVSEIPLNENWDTKKLVFKKLRSLEIVNIPDVNVMSLESDNLRTLLQDLGIMSIAMIPLSYNGVFKGFITADSKRKKNKLDENQLYVLKIAGDMIAALLERKNTELLLLKREQEFEEVIHSLDSVIWKATFDKEGNALTTYISKPMDRMIGFPEGTIGNDWNRFFARIHPDDIDKVTDSLKQSFKQPDTPIDVDYRILSDKGEAVWMSSLGSSHPQDDGTFLMFGTTSNITKRKETENKLRESEALLNEVGRLSKIGGWDLDIGTGIGKWTTEVIKIHELDSFDHADVDTGLRYYPPDTRKIIEKAVNDAVEKAEPYDLELELISAKGNHKWVRTIARPITEDGKVVRLFGTMQDITERKRTENKLRESEALLNEVGRIGQIGGWNLDVASSVINWTPEVARIHETEDLDTLEKALSCYPPDSRTIIEKALKSTIKKARSFDVEVELFTAKNKHKWIRLIGRPETVAGKVVKIIGVLQDITKSKMAENKLLESEERLRVFIEHAPASLAMFDRDMRYIAVSRRWKKDYFLDDKDIIGISHYEIFPEIPDEWKEMHRVAMKGEVIPVEETRFERVDGKVQWVRGVVRPWNAADGTVGGIILFSEDVTERKIAENELRANEERYRSLFEQSNDAIMIHDVNGQILEVNERTCEMFGYSEAELKQRTIVDLTLPEDRDEIGSKMDKLKDEGHYRQENRMLRSNGSIVYVDISASFLKTQNGLVQTVGRDITDRVRAEAVMLNAKIEAETASRTKSEFLANMSHELRTPLNSIIGFSDVMLDGIAGELVPKQEHYMKHISKSGRHLLSLINDILDLSKVEAGKMELHYEIIDVKPVVDEIVTMTQTLTLKKNIVVDVDMPDDLPKVEADRSKIKQILYNLMGNSIKFTTDNGKITFRSAIKGHELQISVIDTGIGISPDDQKKIFKPFSQIDSSTSRKYSGTGLGLALVKELVELHKGRIWVESEIGKGSVFTFGLPIIEEGTN